MEEHERTGIHSYDDAKALLQAFGNTQICVFMYFPQEKKIDVPQNTCEKYFCSPEYFDMPASFADDFVNDEDREAFFEMYRKIDEGATSATTTFRDKTEQFCCRVTLTALRWEEGVPTRDVLGVIEDISDWNRDKQLMGRIQERLTELESESEAIEEVRDLISTAISGQYYALYHIWIDADAFVCYQQRHDGILELVGERGTFSTGWVNYVKGYVEPEDQQRLLDFGDLENLVEHLQGNDTLSVEYRRLGVGWTRGQFIVAKRDEQGLPTNGVYAVVDINAERTKDLERKRAIYEAHHDPLTGAYNRLGFEETVLSYSWRPGDCIGFAMVDIDYFKNVNDSYGHEFGDRVIREVATLLTDTFRTRDSVYRLGGDEFAVLLRDCTPQIWSTLCEKQHRIHLGLESIFENTGVTLSIGVAFSDQGFTSAVQSAADDMLYEAKRAGRAGCVSIEMSTGLKRSWRDGAISVRAQNVLSHNDTGVFRVEYSVSGASEPRLICDEEGVRIFGFSEGESPEGRYREWWANVDAAYRDAVGEAYELAKQGVQSECTYLWNHPQQGKIRVRTGGAGDINGDDGVLYGFHHSMNDATIVERKDDKRQIIDAMGGIYFCSYYVNLEDDSFAILKNAPGEKFLQVQEGKATETLGQFVGTLVCEEDRERMEEFLDLSTLRERIAGEIHLDCEYLSVTSKGWCRATFFPVKYDEQGELTHALFVITSLDAHKAAEARKKAEDRKSIEALYNNVPGGIIMYEWDGKRLRTVHISAFYEREYGYTLNTGEDGQRGPDFARVHPDDLAGYRAAIQEALAKTHELHYDYRVWNRVEDRYLWTHIDAVSEEQPDGTSLVFALYTDVTAQKQLELGLKESQEALADDIRRRDIAMNDYDKRIESILGSLVNCMVTGQCNLSQNTVEFFKTSGEMEGLVCDVASFDDRFARTADYVVGAGAKNQYLRLFSRENLLDQAEQGKMHAKMEYLLQIPGSRTVWVETGVNLVKNAYTGDITAISYTRDVQNARLGALLLKSTLEREHLKTVVVLADTGEFYVMDAQEDGGGTGCKQGFWEKLTASLQPLTDIDSAELERIFSKENIMSSLESEGEFAFGFDNRLPGAEGRLQTRFTWLHKDQNFLLFSLRNITDATLVSRLRYDSRHDALTGLYNRKTVFAKCERLLQEYPDVQFAMLHVDMRHFRLYNTFFGEEAGDKLLCDVADMFRGMDSDYEYWAYGRLQADVFCIFFPYEEERYRGHIAAAFEVLKNYRADFLIESTLGLYLVKDRSMPIEAMFSRATLAAKATGKSKLFGTVFYDEELERALLAGQQVINDMQAAIDEEQFEVYLQPKYSLRTNKPVGAEALVRWVHPEKGLISPAAFIPVFERNGFITTLDRYMWEHVCQILSRWKEEGRPLAPVSVNVSRLSMFGSSTVDFLKGLVKAYDIEPEYLELELTESAYIDDPEEMKAQLTALREAGFRILLDDFGSGYSSLNTLRELPVDVLKLDMRFLSPDSGDVKGGLVLSSIVRMSKLLDLAVIAEGVERREQAEFLKGIGCEYVQGYLFAKPEPVASYEDVLANRDVPLAHVNDPMIGHIGRIIAEMDSATYAMGAVIPSPLAFIEVAGDDFRFLRVNTEFFEEFDLTEDLAPASQAFRRHLGERGIAKLLKGFEEAVVTGLKQQLGFTWDCDDGSQRRYLCRLAYEGDVGGAATIVAVFTNVTKEFGLFED